MKLGKAEFVAASICGQELFYLSSLLRNLAFELTAPTRAWEDNQACIHMSENAHADCSFHIDVKVWFLPDMVRDQDKVIR
jgi:hypothetical protein